MTSCGWSCVLRVVIPGLDIKPVQGWSPAGYRVGGLGKALKTVFRFNPTLNTFWPTVP
jgi:hypothetical protein